MSVDLRAMLEDQRARGLADLAGSRVDATVPIRQALVDELVNAAVSRYPQAELDVRLRDRNRLEVRAGWRIFGFPVRWRLPFALEPHAPLTERPVLFLRLAEPSAAWSAARRAIGGLGVLPAFVRISDEGVVLDLGRLAQQRGVSDLLPIVRALSFDGGDGILWMRVEAEVPPDLPPAQHAVGGAGDDAGTVAHDPDRLLQHLAGARITIALRISERLANEVLAAGLDGVRTGGVAGPSSERGSTPPLAVRRLLGWCRALRVAFDGGALTITTEVLVDGPPP